MVTIDFYVINFLMKTNIEKNEVCDCPVREALQFLNGAWTAEIYWNLNAKPLRFGELKRALQGVSAKVLTHRLRELEEQGVLHREVKDTSPPQVEYSLTPFGKKFVPVLESIADVGRMLLKKKVN